MTRLEYVLQETALITYNKTVTYELRQWTDTLLVLGGRAGLGMYSLSYLLS